MSRFSPELHCNQLRPELERLVPAVGGVEDLRLFLGMCDVQAPRVVPQLKASGEKSDSGRPVKPLRTWTASKVKPQKKRAPGKEAAYRKGHSTTWNPDTQKEQAIW